MNAVWQSRCSGPGSLEAVARRAVRSIHRVRTEHRFSRHGRVPEWFRDSPAKRITRVRFPPRPPALPRHGRVPEWFRDSPALHPSASSARGELRGFDSRHGLQPFPATAACPSGSGIRLHCIHQRAPLAGNYAGSIPATASSPPPPRPRARVVQGFACTASISELRSRGITRVRFPPRPPALPSAVTGRRAGPPGRTTGFGTEPRSPATASFSSLRSHSLLFISSNGSTTLRPLRVSRT